MILPSLLGKAGGGGVLKIKDPGAILKPVKIHIRI